MTKQDKQARGDCYSVEYIWTQRSCDCESETSVEGLALLGLTNLSRFNFGEVVFNDISNVTFVAVLKLRMTTDKI